MVIVTDEFKDNLAAMLQNGVYNLTVRVTVVDGKVICDAIDTVLVQQPLADEYDLEVLKDYQLAHQHAVIEHRR